MSGVNQRHLAESLNLSPATISKAFRNSSDIGAETRARILTEAARLGYRVPLSNKPVLSGEEGVERDARFIGVFYCQGSSDVPQGDQRSVLYLDGLSEAAGFCDSSLVVHRLSGDGTDLLAPDGQPPAFRDGLLSGAILIYRFADKVVRRLAEKMPIVTITHWVPDARCDHVDSDHISGMQRLVAHLKYLGHRHIGYAARGSQYGYEKSRFASFVRALVNEGLHIDPSAFILNRDGAMRQEDIAGCIAGKIKDGVTAWVCSADRLAYQVLADLEALGVNVPGEVSITGFDELESGMQGRRITTVRAPFWEMGITAMERLERRIDNPGIAPIQLLLDCVLIEGDTTGFAPGDSG